MSKFINLFQKMMKISTQKKAQKETQLALLSVDGITEFSVNSGKIGVFLDFSAKETPHISLVASPEFSRESISMHTDVENGKLNLSIQTKLKDVTDVTLNIYLTNIFKTVSAVTSSGDVRIRCCKASNVHLETSSGDICVEDHIDPCTFRLSSQNGDIVKRAQHRKSTDCCCVCKTKNGDIVIS